MRGCAAEGVGAKTVGSMKCVHPSFYQSMEHTKNILVIVIVAALAFGTLLVMFTLNHLVFRRLEQLRGEAVRAVGGDYESKIKIRSDDEVGQVESLFEQFRLLFVHALSSVPELQGKE